MKFDSIRLRLVISYVLLAALTVILVGVLTLTLMSEYIRSQTETQLRDNAAAIATQAEALMQPSPRTEALGELARTLAFLSSTHIRILDGEGAVLVDSGAADLNDSVVWVPRDYNPQRELPFLFPHPSLRMQGGVDEKRMREIIAERSTLVIRVSEGPWGREVFFEEVQAGDWVDPLPTPEAELKAAPTPVSADVPSPSVAQVPIGSAASPLGYVQVENQGAPEREALAAMRRALLLAGLGAALIAAGAGLLVSRSLTAPLQTLANSATRMSGGNLAVRAPVSGASEIRQLAEQFNHMAENLQTSFTALSSERDALRRFIADASHELRTPITALGGFIELLQGPAAADQAARDEFLTESRSQVHRMEWITTNLLDLSRLDAGLVQLDLQPQDVSDLLLASTAPFRSRAEEKGILLEVRSPQPPQVVTCDRARMELVLGNLLDNAIKFTPGEGHVVLSSQPVPENTSDDRDSSLPTAQYSVQITVEDTGPGIDPAEQAMIFERFYRGRASPNGSGLGLAIVHSLVHAHGGRVEVLSKLGKGSRFRILLP